eukprot:s4156_g9.t1
MAECLDPELWSLPEEWPAAADSRVEVPAGKARTESVDSMASPTLVTDVEDHLLKGVGLELCLSGWGKHWSNPDLYGSSSTTSTLSFQVKRYDHFLSHDWETSPRRKIWSLLVIFNANCASVLTVIFAVFLGLAVYGKLLPDEVWVYLLPYVVYIFLLCFWQRLRRLFRPPHIVFFDKMCIDQNDQRHPGPGCLSRSI